MAPSSKSPVSGSSSSSSSSGSGSSSSNSSGSSSSSSGSSSRSRSPTPAISRKQTVLAEVSLPPPPGRDTKQDAKQDTKPESKPDSRSEPKPELKHEAKQDAKAVSQEPAVKAELAAKATSPPAKENKAPEAETSRLHVGHLTRNVQAEHIQEIFSMFGTVKHVELAMDKAVNLPRGFAYVEFSKRSEAEDAQRLMDGGQLDGNQLSVAFVLVPRKPKSPPRQKPSSRAVSPIGRRESDLKDGRDRGYRGRDAPRDDYRNRRPSPPPRRRSPPMRDVRDSRYDRQRRPLSPPRSRRPVSPRGRLPRSPPRRRPASPPRDRQRRRTPTRRSPARRRTRSPAGKGRAAAPQPAQRPVRGRSRSSSSSGSYSSSGSSSRSFSSDSSRS